MKQSKMKRTLTALTITAFVLAAYIYVPYIIGMHAKIKDESMFIVWGLGVILLTVFIIILFAIYLLYRKIWKCIK